MVNPLKRFRVPKHKGVFYRESSVRRHKGIPDKCFDICYRSTKGTLVWEKIGWMSDGYTAAFADQIRAERIRTIRHGGEIPKKKQDPTLGEIWKKYNEWLNTGKILPNSDRSYYKNHIEPVLANKTLSQISPFDLEKLKINLINKGLAQATIKHVLVIVRQLINKAITWGMWSGENPIKKINLPKPNNRRERFLASDETQKLLKTLWTTSPVVHDIALLSLYTGMRVGEIFALKWSHLDLDNGLIHIADPKNQKSRKAFMTPTITKMFSSYTAGEPEDHIFQSTKGGKIKEISHTFDRIVKLLGLNEGIIDTRQKVVFHTLRHTFASWLAIQGTPIYTIKELLGHQTLAMTERYSHLSPDHKRQAVEGIERVFMSANINADKSPSNEGNVNENK
jgi:integrase